MLRYNKTGYYIEYYAINPATGILQRKKIKLNVLRKRYLRVSEFKLTANKIVVDLNIKLAGGWSPFFEGDNARLYEPIKVVLEKYLFEKNRELRESTLVSYSSFVHLFGLWCSKNTPNTYASMFGKISAVRYMEYVYNERKVSARTYNNQLKMGRAFFTWAKEKCYVKENPFETIKTKREQEKKRILIPPESRNIITDYLKEQNNTGMLIVCQLVFNSLIRPKEILLIQVKHLFLDKNYILIPGKNAKNYKERYATISPATAELLKSYLSEKKYPIDYFLFGETFKPEKTHCGKARFRKEWDKMRKALQLPQEMQLYSLRDTGINELLKSGVDPLTVMQHADHHDLSITTRYAKHADPNLIKTIYEKGVTF